MKYMIKLLIIIGILLLSILFKKIINSDENQLSKIINTLIRQAARWSAAAQQDESPIIALLHANYGAGYLWALKDIASDQEIEKSTGINVLTFKKKIINIQDEATKKVSRMCPQFVGHLDNYLLKLAGDV